MLSINVLEDLKDFFEPFIDIVKDILFEIESFFLQYFEQDVFNILVVGIIIAFLLIIVLSMMNKR